MAGKKRTSGRLNTSLSERGWKRLHDLEQVWFPGRERVNGLVVERAIDEAWERMQSGWGDPYRPRHVAHNGENGIPPAIPTELDPPEDDGGSSE